MRNSVCDSVADPPHQTGPDPLTSVGEITSESGRGYTHDGTPRDRAPLVVGVRDVTDVGNSFLLSSFIFPLHYPSVSRPTYGAAASVGPSLGCIGCPAISKKAAAASRALFCVSDPCGHRCGRCRGGSSSSGGRTSVPRTPDCSCSPCKKNKFISPFEC